MANLRYSGSACFVLGVLLAAACSADGGTGTTTGGSDSGGAPSAGDTSKAGGSAGQSSSAGSTPGGTAAGGGGMSASGAAGAGGDTGGVSGGGGGSGGAGAGRPNIVVVLLDDMGFADLGAYGSEIRTPSIDALAQNGTRFRNFHVTPRCSPTRMALLTGLYTQQAAVMPGASLPPIRSDNNVTLPEMLRDAGYRTYMAGKWHLGAEADQAPAARGFDHVFGFGPQGAGAEASKWDKTAYGFVSKNNAIPARSYGDKDGDFYQADAIGDYALDYLDYSERQKDGKPFFMYLAFNAPHFPVQAPRSLVLNAPASGGKSYEEIYGQGWNALRSQRYANMLAQGVIDASFGLSPQEPFMKPVQEIPLWSALTAPQKADLTRKMGLYAASIEAVDTAVGRVVAHLKAKKELDNTLIFVLSDNGGNYEGGVVGSSFGKPDALTGAQLANMGQPNQPKDHMQVGGGWASVETTPFRFFKHYTHGGGVRSPLVFSWPARTARPGAWTNQVSHVIDLAPTILEAAGVTQPTKFANHDVLPLEGTSLVSAITGDAAPIARHIGFEHETNRAYIDGKFKLIVRHENNDTVELYDLETDPTELDDLAKSMPAKAKDMVRAWNEWAKRVGVPAERLLAEP